MHINTAPNLSSIQHVDYKDVETLKKFLNPHGRIIAHKRTGVSSKIQKQVSLAIKRARFLGLLPYIAR
ncbi:MAG: 30S ribosomal protein S18 [Candidatus Taylorbacteria bacterium RIFCSPHIGHO2_02_FULL_46_13]|uniref:Small ribosomal subunit protein bS18 n=1 Tax=Candidatus Taylorbacteria bacterium RIFCSPHIGHO2_02_FULL_46_13 TaxID=1802312 RepID=A0A1G2MTY0_9BACT|nr:MAG: 30S ribosomal protein S18 [Candidatus Taylorbacteria bacterium RIFCSPHIGHO2_02_FULL_46_13]